MDDLESRGRELHASAQPLQAERSRLAAVVNSMPDAVLVVDQPSGQAMLTNAALDRMFRPLGRRLSPWTKTATRHRRNSSPSSAARGTSRRHGSCSDAAIPRSIRAVAPSV
jgi:two-component system CheB/CheR fusion protein